MERAHQEIARAVTREDAARAIGTMGRGGESYNQESGVWVPEARDGATPVDVVAVGELLVLRDAAAVLPQAWAAFARHDRLVDGGKSCGKRG
jgi:hypothetical protein